MQNYFIIKIVVLNSTFYIVLNTNIIDGMLLFCVQFLISKIIKMNSKTPIILTSLELSDIQEMIHSAVECAMQNVSDTHQPQKKLIKGIHSLAKYLNISPATAQRLKNENVIPCFQKGRVLLFDQHEVLAALKQK